MEVKLRGGGWDQQVLRQTEKTLSHGFMFYVVVLNIFTYELIMGTFLCFFFSSFPISHQTILPIPTNPEQEGQQEEDLHPDKGKQKMMNATLLN